MKFVQVSSDEVPIHEKLQACDVIQYFLAGLLRIATGDKNIYDGGEKSLLFTLVKNAMDVIKTGDFDSEDSKTGVLASCPEDCAVKNETNLISRKIVSTAVGVI